jgi:uncharacterized protein involved in response to NO
MTAALPRSESVAQSVSLQTVICDEGFRLFFPLAALQLSIWPVLWTLIHGLELPFAHTTPPSLWHAHEMLVGGFGAALVGFITTAVPEWTDTDRLRGRPLVLLAAAWAGSRAIGLLGADALNLVAGALDAFWLAALVIYVLNVSWLKRTTRLLAFAGWIGGLLMAVIATRIALAAGDIGLAQTFIRLIVLIFIGLLGLALARITVPVTNLVLDPSERTSPYRPHPGRLNIAPGLTAIAIGAELLGLSPVAQGYLWIAAGAGFMDRVAEAFIGREAFRAEILALAGSALLAGTGLMLVGAGRLGAAIPEVTALHVLLMGGLGLGVLSVFAIVGLLHTGRPLGVTSLTKLALLLVVAGASLRVLPDFGAFSLPGPLHGFASLVWASAFLIWIKDYFRSLSDAATVDARAC